MNDNVDLLKFYLHKLKQRGPANYHLFDSKCHRRKAFIEIQFLVKDKKIIPM